MDALRNGYKNQLLNIDETDVYEFTKQVSKILTKHDY